MPHFTSVINWVLRYGLFKLAQVGKLAKPWAAIIDHSIDIGVKKILVVLRVPLDHFAHQKRALTLLDCECIGLSVSEASDHETIAKQLREIFEVAGNPTIIIKDGAANLAKGLACWKQEAKPKLCVIIDDIGHYAANALKAEFSKLKQFQKLLTIIRKGGARLRQTNLAYLTPPKVRTKGRFQSISKLASWCENMLGSIAIIPDQEIKKRLQGAFNGLSSLKLFVTKFSTTTETLNKIQKILKTQGLSHATFCQSIQLINQISSRSKVHKRLLKWLKSHYAKSVRLGLSGTPLPVSSDILESLFGRFKTIISRSSIEDINRMALVIPALCGQLPDAQALKQVFIQTRHDDIKKWSDKHISHTLKAKRREFKEQYEWPKQCQKAGKKAA